jgi:hypothetical protein
MPAHVQRSKRRAATRAQQAKTPGARTSKPTKHGALSQHRANKGTQRTSKFPAKCRSAQVPLCERVVQQQSHRVWPRQTGGRPQMLLGNVPLQDVKEDHAVYRVRYADEGVVNEIFLKMAVREEDEDDDNDPFAHEREVYAHLSACPPLPTVQLAAPFMPRNASHAPALRPGTYERMSSAGTLHTRRPKRGTMRVSLEKPGGGELQLVLPFPFSKSVCSSVWYFATQSMIYKQDWTLACDWHGACDQLCPAVVAAVEEFVDTTGVMHNDLKTQNLLLRQRAGVFQFCFFDFDLSVRLVGGTDRRAYHTDSFYHFRDRALFQPLQARAYAKAFDCVRYFINRAADVDEDDGNAHPAMHSAWPEHSFARKCLRFAKCLHDRPALNANTFGQNGHLRQWYSDYFVHDDCEARTRAKLAERSQGKKRKHPATATR